MIVETTRMKQLWDGREKTNQEKNLVFADHVADELSSGKRQYNKDLDIIYNNPPLNPHEITALELYDQLCSSLEMKKEDR